MTDGERPLTDDELAALLRHVGDDPSLRAQDRARARTEMLAEFDAIVGDADRAASKEHLSVVPAFEFDHEHRRTSSRSFVFVWSAAAAACLIVLSIVVVANLRTAPATSDTPDTSVPRTLDTLPAVGEPARPLPSESLPIALGDATYRTDEIRNGVTFSGADELQLVALRPGLIVLDAVSDDGGLQARVSIFEADPTLVAEVIDGASDNGDLQVSVAQFSGADQSLRRQDLTVTSKGVADLGCIAQTGCLPLIDGVDDFDPSIWARSENFLVQTSSDDPSVFVLVQTKAFSDPVLGQAFEIIDSLRFG